MLKHSEAMANIIKGWESLEAIREYGNNVIFKFDDKGLTETDERGNKYADGMLNFSYMIRCLKRLYFRWNF